MDLYKKQSISETFKVYFDRRMIKILLLGAISGFPWVIIGSSLSLWLKEVGLQILQEGPHLLTQYQLLPNLHSK